MTERIVLTFSLSLMFLNMMTIFFLNVVHMLLYLDEIFFCQHWLTEQIVSPIIKVLLSSKSVYTNVYTFFIYNPFSNLSRGNIRESASQTC